MTIARPGRRLLRDVPLPFVRRRIAGGGQRPVTASLSLTSMIDFLVVAVVFLLLTFSPSEGALEKNVKVPGAGNALDMIDAPMVTIAGSQILIDGRVGGNTRSLEEHKRLERLDELASILGAKRETWKQLHPNREFPVAVILQIDQDVPTVVVKSVFQTAANAGYPNISFMVQHDAQAAAR
jgi:biopolymer transport protein ExbD